MYAVIKVNTIFHTNIYIYIYTIAFNYRRLSWIDRNQIELKLGTFITQHI